MSSDLKARLQQLKELHELGLLTDEAYHEQQKALLSAAMGTTPTPLPSAGGPLSGATHLGSLPQEPTPPPTPPPGMDGPLSGATSLGSLPQEPTPTPPPSAGGPLSGATHIDPSGGLSLIHI